jgi:hypothetical protein
MYSGFHSVSHVYYNHNFSNCPFPGTGNITGLEVTPPMPVPSPDAKGGGFMSDIPFLDKKKCMFRTKAN